MTTPPLSDGLDPPLHCMVKSRTVVEIDELDESFERSKNLGPKRFVTNFCAFLSRNTINQTYPKILYHAILICNTHMFIISRNGCFSLDCILNILKLTYLSKRLTSDVVRRDCRSFCTPRSRSFCCRSTAPSSVLHTRLDTQ